MAGIKYHRAAAVRVTSRVTGEQETFTYPPPGIHNIPSSAALGIRMRFSVKKSWTQEPNTCSVTLYNLNSPARAVLLTSNSNVEIAAGYLGLSGDGESDVATIFKGQLTDAVDSKDSVTRTTTISANTRNGNQQTQLSFRKDLLLVDALREALGKLKDVDISQPLRELPRLVFRDGANKFHKGAAFSGDSWTIVNDILGFSNGSISIQDEVAILDFPGLAAEVDLFTPQTGLIGTPSISTSMSTNFLKLITFKVLLTPKLQPGRLCQVEWSTGNSKQIVVGKIRTIQHTGDTEGSEWYSDVEALITESSSYQATDAVTTSENIG